MKRNNNVYKNDCISSEMKHKLNGTSPKDTDKLHTHNTHRRNPIKSRIAFI